MIYQSFREERHVASSFVVVVTRKIVRTQKQTARSLVHCQKITQSFETLSSSRIFQFFPFFSFQAFLVLLCILNQEQKKPLL